MTSAIESMANGCMERQLKTRTTGNQPTQWATETSVLPRALPGDLPPVPEIDEAMLPDSLRPWIMDAADRMSCPPDFLAVGAMVALATVVGRQVGIRPKKDDDWTVVPNLWGAVIGRPGILKTPALSEMLKPLVELENQSRQRYLDALSDYEADNFVIESERKQLEKKINQAIKNGNRGDAADLSANMVANKPAPPVRSRYLTQDASTEKLGELLADNPRGLLVFRDELSGWLSNLERPSDMGARSFYLEAWNGTGSFTYDRIGRGTIDIESAAVSILGGIQPGPLNKYIAQTKGSGAGDDGLLQRFQVVCWPDPPRWKDVDREPNMKARQDAFDVWQRLDCIDPKCISANTGDSIPFLRFDPEAQAAWLQWRAELEERITEGQESAAFESVLAKYRSLVPSLALLTHLADHPNGGPVPMDCLLKAFAWAEYLEAHQRRIYAPALSDEITGAKKLAEKIKKGEIANQFSARDIYRKCWGGLDKEATEAALDYLVDSFWLFKEEHQDNGRPSTVYHINPGCFK